jgi:DNA-binding MarR family transcriptional regulator
MEARGMSLEGYEQLKLENQLCFPLYAAAKEVVRKYKPFLDELDLTYTQYITMMVLWEKEELNVKELGSMLYLDSGTLTPLLKKLEAKGYISRNRCKEDERNLIIQITEKGDALKEKAAKIPAEMAEKWINISKEEVKTMYHALYRLLSQIQ